MTPRSWGSAMAQGAGRIRAAGAETEVTFTAADPSVNGVVDDAYRTKYAGSPYLPPMVADRARAATVRIDPR